MKDHEWSKRDLRPTSCGGDGRKHALQHAASVNFSPLLIRVRGFPASAVRPTVRYFYLSYSDVRTLRTLCRLEHCVVRGCQVGDRVLKETDSTYS